MRLMLITMLASIITLYHELKIDNLAGSVVIYVKKQDEKGDQTQIEPTATTGDWIEDDPSAAWLFIVQFS